MTDASELFRAARERLVGSPREHVGEWAISRKVLGIGRSPRIVPVGDAWRVGVLLITDDGALSVGEVVRSRQDAPRGFTAEAQRERSERMAAAYRGGFADGEHVHVGWHEIDLAAVDRGESSGILSVIDGEPFVTWSTSGEPRPLAAYLHEQLGLR